MGDSGRDVARRASVSRGGPMSRRPLVSVVFGTRPEAIKLWKVVDALREIEALETRVTFSGQHEHLVAPIARQLALTLDESLVVMREGQPLGELLGRLVAALHESFERRPPQMVVVQGDTLTALAATMVAFHRQVPVAHVEAGLRSGRLDSPFPEEGARTVIDVLAHLNFAPTPRALENARQMARARGQEVLLTGNTVVEAARAGVRLAGGAQAATGASRSILVTLHRRENIGERHRTVMGALRTLLREDPTLRVVLPLHPNPEVQAVVREEARGVAGFDLRSPMGYLETLSAIAASDAILTDSGGIQEEAPALGRRVLVARESTERPEGIEEGWARLLPFETDAIVRMLREELGRARPAVPEGMTPYGDGLASARIADAIECYLTGRSRRVPDLHPSSWRGAARGG
jgi:UDP-N-acetylglucosamine 2-epimerase (non-hydrolysing)